jgi:hypothetical protein
MHSLRWWLYSMQLASGPRIPRLEAHARVHSGRQCVALPAAYSGCAMAGVHATCDADFPSARRDREAIDNPLADKGQRDPIVVPTAITPGRMRCCGARVIFCSAPSAPLNRRLGTVIHTRRDGRAQVRVLAT